jgi:FMN phosphatase YigB (HAD superfamily)
MIEDDVRNLEAPKALGMVTVWLCHRAGARAPAFVDRRITRLTRFLQELA